MKFKTVLLSIHLVLWSVIGLIVMNYSLREVPLIDAIQLTLYTIFLAAIPFYLNYFYISRILFVYKDYWRFAFFILLILSVPIFIVNFTNYGWLVTDETTYNATVDAFTNFFLFLFLSTSLKGMETWFHHWQQETLREKRKLENELKFLKLQINPHFLFNTLNNIYSLAYQGDPNAAKMIARLSQILRYMLYDCSEQKVSLSKEIELLKSYIDLQKLKQGAEQNVDFYIEGITQNQKIAPLLLLTFLENCYKHGEIGRSEKGWIKISAIADDNHFEFMITNNVSSSNLMKTEQKGLGLNNIRKQLELTYPEKYTLDIRQDKEIFEVNLTLELN